MVSFNHQIIKNANLLLSFVILLTTAKAACPSTTDPNCPCMVPLLSQVRPCLCNKSETSQCAVENPAITYASNCGQVYSYIGEIFMLIFHTFIDIIIILSLKIKI